MVYVVVFVCLFVLVTIKALLILESKSQKIFLKYNQNTKQKEKKTPRIYWNQNLKLGWGIFTTFKYKKNLLKMQNLLFITYEVTKLKQRKRRKQNQTVWLLLLALTISLQGVGQKFMYLNRIISCSEEDLVPRKT